jgi:hypothetical protein
VRVLDSQVEELPPSISGIVLNNLEDGISTSLGVHFRKAAILRRRYFIEELK